MYGADFLRRLIATHGENFLLEKIKERQRVLVFICEKCGSARLFWHDEMVLQDHIHCPKEGCGGTMTLMDVPIEQAKQVPKIWERVEFNTALGL